MEVKFKRSKASTAVCVGFNVLLRDKYITYAIAFAIGSALFYLYGHGLNHWTFNPVLYGLWTDQDLESSDRVSQDYLAQDLLAGCFNRVAAVGSCLFPAKIELS